MTKSLSEFKRMVVQLPHSAIDYAAVGVTAELAELLRLHLVAAFTQDVSLLDVARLPCVRELRPLGGGWHPIDAAELAQQFARAEYAARSQFGEIARRHGLETSFDVASGSAADMIASLVQKDDIIVIIEPRNPAERVTAQFTHLTDAALNAAAAVMIVPSRIARTAGPIIAVAKTPDDPSVRAALAIAAATEEKVLILGPQSNLKLRPEVMKLAQAVGVDLEPIRGSKEPLDMLALAAGLYRIGERLVVMTRNDHPDLAPLPIASGRGVPVLLVEPDRSIS